MIKVMKLYYIVKPLCEDEIEVAAIAGPFFMWDKAMSDKQATPVKIC